MQDREYRFRAIYDAHSRLVYNFLYRFIGDESEASDAVTETFRRAYRGLDAYRGDCSEKAWLMKIATNVAKRAKVRYKRNNHASLDAHEFSEPACPFDAERLILDGIEAERMLAMLEPQPRAAVWMRVGLRMTDEEVAEALGVPVGTVKSWVWRSLAKLRRACEAEAN
jgi:RNA polymerase sigma-70 factor (ECF subfamily)